MEMRGALTMNSKPTKAEPMLERQTIHSDNLILRLQRSNGDETPTRFDTRACTCPDCCRVRCRTRPAGRCTNRTGEYSLGFFFVFEVRETTCPMSDADTRNRAALMMVTMPVGRDVARAIERASYSS